MLQQPDTWPMRPMYEYPHWPGSRDRPIDSAAGDGVDLSRTGSRSASSFAAASSFTTAWASSPLKMWSLAGGVIKPDSFASNAPYWRGVLKDIEIVNDYEVIFRLTRPDGTFLDLVSESESGFEIRSKAASDAIGEPTLQTAPLAGTGPYQLKERSQSQFVRYERVPYQHWRATPGLPRVRIPLPGRVVNPLRGPSGGRSPSRVVARGSSPAGAGSWLQGRARQSARVADIPEHGLLLHEGPQGPIAGLGVSDSPLMRTVRVRKALDKSINRDEMNKAFFASKGELMMVDHFHPSRMGWDPMFEQRFPDEYGYDPAKARALLAEGRLRTGKALTTTILVQPLPFYSGAEDVADAIGGYFRAVGVSPEMLTMDSGEIRNVARQRKFNNHYEVRGTSAGLMSGMIGYHWGGGPAGSGMEDPSWMQR